MWKANTEAEHLLGVSLTGIVDNQLMGGQLAEEALAPLLQQLREEAVATNVSMAADLGIPASHAVTCIKPSGTVSQLVNSASGIHPRHAQVGWGAAWLYASVVWAQVAGWVAGWVPL